MDEAQEDVLGADVVVVEKTRLILREHNDSAGAIGKPLEHESPLVFRRCLRAYCLPTFEGRLFASGVKGSRTSA